MVALEVPGRCSGASWRYLVAALSSDREGWSGKGNPVTRGRGRDRGAPDWRKVAGAARNARRVAPAGPIAPCGASRWALVPMPEAPWTCGVAWR